MRASRRLSCVRRYWRNLENEIVVGKHGHLDTGLLGTFVLLDLLIRENRNDLVDLIMGQTTYPGWGYLVKELDLKTWPETWSGWGSHVILVTATPGSWFYRGAWRYSARSGESRVQAFHTETWLRQECRLGQVQL